LEARDGQSDFGRCNEGQVRGLVRHCPVS
jgi:hypothetical protein